MRLAGEEYFLPALLRAMPVSKIRSPSKPARTRSNYAKVECTVDEPVTPPSQTEGPEHALATRPRIVTFWLSFRAASLEIP